MKNLLVAKKKLEKIRKEVLSWNPDIKAALVSRRFNKEFKTLSVKFRFEKMNNYFAAGEYDPYRESTKEPKYLIYLGYDKRFSIWFWLNTDMFYEEVYLILSHEFRHGYQHRKRKYKVLFHNKRISTLFDYYTNKDELDAYAFEVAKAFEMYKKKKMLFCNYWVIDAYKKVVKPISPKMYNRFLKKVYLLSEI